MLIQTHLYLANELQKTINKKGSGFLINSSSFKSGSIMPDLIPEKRYMPHEFSVAFNFVIKKIDAFSKGKWTKEEDISYVLGIITHFLADFFCLAHNEQTFQKNLWKHFKYELSLHRTLTSLCIVESNTYIEPQYMENWLRNKHMEYLNLKASIATDAMFIQEICYIVCNSLIKSLARVERKSA